MKTLKRTASVLLLTGALSFPAMNTSAQTYAMSTGERLKKETKDINRDLARIKYQKQQIAQLKEEYKANKAADNEAAAIANKEELCKARADLSRSEAYLAADKRSLINAHNLAISNYKKDVKDDRADLAAAKKQLKKNSGEVNEEAAHNRVLLAERELDRSKAALQRQRVQRSDDVIALNKKLKDENVVFVGALYSENSVAYMGKVMNK